MPYDAITIDTGTVDRNHLKLETGLLGQLVQFKDSPTTFILSDVVIREIERHLVKFTAQTRDTLLSHLPALPELGLIGPALAESHKLIIEGLKDPASAASARMEAFLLRCGVERVPVDLCASTDVIDLYFAKRPPFEPTGKKKSEFPDAIALLSLEVWARASGAQLLAVSPDKGWHDYAATSSRIDVVSDLGEALALVQTHTEAATVRLAAFLGAIMDGDAEEAATTMHAALAEPLATWSFFPASDTPYDYQATGGMLVYDSIRGTKPDGGVDFSIVRLGSLVTVVKVNARFLASAQVDFVLTGTDNYTGEPYDAGSVSADKDIEFEGSFLLTIGGDPAGPMDGLGIMDVDLIDAIEVVDFGALVSFDD